MATVTIGLGTNLGDKMAEIAAARDFLRSLSDSAPQHAPVYKTEPIGPSKFYYFNSVSKIQTDLSPGTLIKKLKKYEQSRGRPVNPPKWSARIIDLDIIGYDNLVLHNNQLDIPHPEYAQRLFVLKPLQDVDPDWTDPETRESIDELIRKAAEMEIEKV